MKLKTAHKRAKRKERLTKVLGFVFQGKSGREIERALRELSPYRSRRPVEVDTRPVPF